MKTYNFKAANYDYNCPEHLRGEFRDVRNGIICINPTADMECYLNYIEFLNLNRDKWKSYGYLDKGMMPVAMAPSFLQQGFSIKMMELMAIYKIPCYAMPPVSLLLSKCNMIEEDIWVFKSDVEKVMNTPSNQITVNRFMTWCMKQSKVSI